MVTERCNVVLVEDLVVLHVGEEAGGLHHVRHRRSHRRKQRLNIFHCLLCLSNQATIDLGAVKQTSLTRDDNEVASTDDRRIRTEGLAHVSDSNSQPMSQSERQTLPTAHSRGAPLAAATTPAGAF